MKNPGCFGKIECQPDSRRADTRHPPLWGQRHTQAVIQTRRSRAAHFTTACGSPPWTFRSQAVPADSPSRNKPNGLFPDEILNAIEYPTLALMNSTRAWSGKTRSQPGNRDWLGLTGVSAISGDCLQGTERRETLLSREA
jgi:hypothetical protein